MIEKTILQWHLLQHKDHYTSQTNTILLWHLLQHKDHYTSQTNTLQHKDH